MPSPDMPLQEVLQALSRTSTTQPQLRAALATTCARWHLLRGETSDAVRELGHALEMVPDLRPAIRLLYRIYLDRGDVRSAVMYLDQEIRATRHPREAAALYRERGQLVEAHFNDLGAAEQCYQAALRATPRDLAVLRSVERTSLARGDLYQLIANLETQFEVLQDQSSAAGVLHDLALLEARHHGDPDLAGDLLMEAIDRVGNHSVLGSDLFRIAEMTSDEELMLQALEVIADAHPPGSRAFPLARASVVLREHRDRDGALALLLAAARDQPENVTLWRSVEELAMATGHSEAAFEAVIGHLKAVGDREEPWLRGELYYRLGRLSLTVMDRPTDGLTAMRKALRLAPGHPLVMEDTGRFLNTHKMWAQHLELIKQEIGLAARAQMTAEEVALAHLRAGEVMEHHLGEFDGARKHYEDALTSAPSFRPPRDRLERVLHQTGDSNGLRRHYADELERAQSPERRVFLLSVLAQLHSVDTDPATAIDYLEALLNQSPEHLSSLQLLARLLARAGRKDRLLEITLQEISLTETPARKAKLLHHAGELSLALDDRVAARRHFEEALELVDDHLPSLSSLGQLLREEADHEALIGLLRTELLYANDRARQVSLQLEIAAILATHLDRKSEALDELRTLLRRWPRHLPALHAAEGLANALGLVDVELEFVEQHIAAINGPRTRALLLQRVAELRTKLEDWEGAIHALSRALDLWPQLGVARARLLQLYERLGRSRDLQAFAEAGLTAERGADDRRAMAIQLADLSPQPVVALQYLGAVAEARPEDYTTQLRLARASQQACRPARQAGALRAAVARIGSFPPDDALPPDQSLLALRFAAARAEEAAGNMEAADKGYAELLDLAPNHLLAQRGRARIKRRRQEGAQSRSAEDFESAARDGQHSPPAKAALLTIAAEMHERRKDYPTALRKLEAALKASHHYLPALHAQARVLERMGQPEHLFDAINTLQLLVDRLSSPARRAQILIHAGTLALQVGEPGEGNPRAWKLFADAVDQDPSSSEGIRGLMRTLSVHGSKGAPSLARSLRKRVSVLHAQGELSIQELRELAHLANEVDGPSTTIELLKLGITPNDDAPVQAGIYIDLARAHAQLDQWDAVVDVLDAALELERLPEQRASLHYYAGEANEHAGRLQPAIEHYLSAGRRGFHAHHALAAADRVAAKMVAAGDTSALEARVEALQTLVDLGDHPQRIQALRELAELHRGPLDMPDRAVELMRELLQLRPTDLEVISELRRLLRKLGRADEATAVVLAGIAQHRAWWRSTDATTPSDLDPGPLAGLLRLFAATQDAAGVYMSARVLEFLAPNLIPHDLRPEILHPHAWPLPRPQNRAPFDGLNDDLPCAFALDLMREGMIYLDSMPIEDGLSEDYASSRTMPSPNALATVVRRLAEAMGVPLPLILTDDGDLASIRTFLTPAPTLLIGRQIAQHPTSPIARDAIGRALWRLATGGDVLHYDAGPAQLLAILVALCNAAGVELETPFDYDEALADAIQSKLPPTEHLTDLLDVAKRFRDTAAALTPPSLLAGLKMGEDRAGAVCAGDPFPALEQVFAPDMPPFRARLLVSYLVSDAHLALQRALGDPFSLTASPSVHEATL